MEVEEATIEQQAPESAETENAAIVEKEGEATTPASDQADGVESAAEAQGEEEVVNEGEDEHKKPPRGVQKRLDEITKEKYEWKREAEYWREVAMAGKPADKQASSAGEVTEEGIAVSGKPKPDDYDDYNEYVDAVTDWKIQDRETKAILKAQESRQQSEFQQKQESFNVAIAASKAKHADYDDIMESAKSIPCPQSMRAAIMDSQDGGEILYYLAKNPAEASRISQLSVLSQAREIGRIEHRLATPVKPPEPRRITNTGEPIKTVSGAGVTEKDPGKMSMEDYARWRLAQG